MAPIRVLETKAREARDVVAPKKRLAAGPREELAALSRL
jgi:hypothetical protein